MDQDQIKKIVAEKALDFLKNHTKIGIGSGSTVFEFIKALATKVHQGLQVEVICASFEAENLAKSLNIPINNSLETCDIYFDGADEIDHDKNCLKGRGKALLREKIIASMSREVIIMVDESKKNLKLQNAPLVCEILPFGHLATIRHIKQLGFNGSLRLNENKKPVITDNGNYLFDITLEKPIIDPSFIQDGLKKIPGFIESGLFFNIVNKILIGLKEGEVIVYE
jgi:ribose 5-phosphate isomerase A